MTRRCSLQDAAKVLAKSLLRNRAAVTKMHQLKANLQAVSLKISVRTDPTITSRGERRSVWQCTPPEGLDARAHR